MQIAFRVDASLQIGSGHLMRCLTLANKLKENGDNCTFFCRHLPDNLQSMIQSNGHQFKLLKNNHVSPVAEENYAIADLAHSAWLGVSQTQDAHDTIAAMQLQIVDWLVVDHYALDFRWQALLRSETKHILVIDDLADRTHDCDALLDQNFYVDMATRYISRVPAHCQLLLGPTFALLRPEFAKARQTVKARTGKVQRILVFFGGMDADNVTGRALAALQQIDLKGIAVDVVIGAQHPARQTIVADCLRLGFTCHVQTDNMAALMATADLAIGAGGSATWERCCLGLPSLSISIASNQQRQIADAAEEGLLYAPSGDDDLVMMLKQHVKALCENAPLLKMISKAAMKAVDGRGALRINRKFGFTEIGQSSVSDIAIRLATAEDAALVWPWRNSESTRRYFFNSCQVSLNAHVMWWNESLSNPKRVLLLGKLDEKEFGVVRYDIDDSSHAKVSIYLNPEMTGRGLGECLLRAGQDWFLQNHPEVKTMSAEIKATNIASLRIFQANGFQEQHIVMLREGF